MNDRHFQRWLDAWGYSEAPGSLHMATEEVPAEHVYRREIQDLLDPRGAVRAHAVFDVNGVPTVCFLSESGDPDPTALKRIRERVWNQNLISIVLSIGIDQACAFPVGSPDQSGEKLALVDAASHSAFSCAEVQSGDVFVGRPDWFSAENRVDRVLLANLRTMVAELENQGLAKVDAQLLMAQVMFVSYLEHRGIVGETYRRDHQVGSLLPLVGGGDVAGIVALLGQLKDDFNGDLLPGETDSFWQGLKPQTLALLHEFLQRTELNSGQRDLWHYDFRYIPVELISGVYESFLADDKRDVGAYYTPRHLAMLVVDLALSRSADPLAERIYDGACGSGILLTTAYRRLLSMAEARRGRQLAFEARIELLKSSIFGSDLNLSACRVTAFSLYLSVLEGLEPADLAILTAQKQSKLPRLVGRNLQGGEVGDFFSSTNPRFAARDCTIFLSNPPWVEPKKRVVLSSDTWAQTHGLEIPRRQTAGAFLLRAADCTTADATLCFILPVSLLAAPSSRAFLRDVLSRYRIQTLINFGDVRKLLFAAARQPCLVLLATPRAKQEDAPAPQESIAYWVPKADLSFAFGRLTLHDSDRHQLRAQSLAYNNELLTTLFWGNSHDAALLTTMRTRGTLGGFIKKAGWDSRKGFHAHDASVDEPESSKPLWRNPFLDAKKFACAGPILDETVLTPFPRERYQTVARLPDALRKVFRRPRIVLTDGMTPQRAVCAAFSTEPFSFTSSIGALVAPDGQEDMLRFVALYLQSDLARYCLILTAFQIAFERERVSLKDLKGLPFISPDEHANPRRAKAIVSEVSRRLKALERSNPLVRADRYVQFHGEVQSLLAEYFDLTAAQAARIGEVVSLVLESVQPGALHDLHTPLQRRPTQAAVQTYARTLLHELGQWREALGGSGKACATLLVNDRGTHGPLGILRITPTSIGKVSVTTERSDDAVKAVIDVLRDQHLLPTTLHENLYAAANVVIRDDDTLYLIKPLLCRFWLQGEAQRDAERIVRAVQPEASE